MIFFSRSTKSKVIYRKINEKYNGNVHGEAEQRSKMKCETKTVEEIQITVKYLALNHHRF